MTCKCKNPKKMNNSAGGVDFVVCAKSKGGCGQQIEEKKEPESYGDPGDEAAYPGLIFWSECPDCEGTGSIPKSYPSGYVEISCTHCNGSGRV